MAAPSLAEAVLPVAAQLAHPPLAPAKTRAHRGLASLTLAGFELDAVSVGGQETCVVVPALRLAFDVGRCPQRAVVASALLLSHCHLDHVGGAGAYVATRSLLCLPLPTVYVPAQCAAPLGRHFDTLRELDGSTIPCVIQPVVQGETLPLCDGRFLARPFVTYHPVPSTGYCVYSRRSKLLAEFTALPGPAIAALRKAGTTVTRDIEVSEIAFTGDTSADWITHPSAEGALNAKLLIVECTFVDDAVSIAQARAYGHTHLDELIAHADRFHNEAILLVHFSARYRRADIEAALEAKLPPSLKGRVTPLLEGFM